MRGKFLKLGLIILAIFLCAFFAFNSKQSVKAASSVTVSGAGIAGFNGEYSENGTYGGQTAYSLDAGHWLWYKADVPVWILSGALGFTPACYHGEISVALPGNPWYVAPMGAPPAPTLSYTPSPEPPTPPTPTPTPEPTPEPSSDTVDQSSNQTPTNASKTNDNPITTSNQVAETKENIKERLSNTAVGNLLIDTASEISNSLTPVVLLSLAAAATAVSTIASLAALFFSQVSLKEFILMVFNYLFSIFKTKNKGKFGIIYDQLTKKPLPGAIIRLFEYPTMKMISSAVSDSKGHYYFTVKPGEYVISVIKKGFVFPSKSASREAHYMEQAYFGQTIKVASEASIINAKIPLDRTLKSKIKRPILLDLLTSNIIRYTVLIIGTIIAIFIMATVGGLSNFVMATFYLILWIFEFIAQHREYKFNRVIDQNNKLPIDLAVVRVMSPAGKLVETNVTDFKGRFVARLNDQSDKISIDRVGYKHLEAKPNKKGLLEGKRYFLNKA